MKKIVVFSGAGLDKESGIETFRDSDNGLWYNYEVDKVSTAEALKNTPEDVFNFHNKLRRELHDIKPNKAHYDLVKLEEKYNVIHITQNVSNLLEKVGSTKVLHLHGELFKSRNESGELFDCFGDLNYGDVCLSGKKLRPHTVLFGEYPFNIEEAMSALLECDYLIVIGTSLPINYTIQMLRKTNENAKIFYVDLVPQKYLEAGKRDVTYVTECATIGVEKVIKMID